MNNTVFLSEYNELNERISNFFDHSGFWTYDVGLQHPKIFANVDKMGDLDFCKSLSEFLWDLGFEPDCIFIKGNVLEIMPLSSIKREKIKQCKMVSVIEKIKLPLDVIDIRVLEPFDINIVFPEDGDDWDAYLALFDGMPNKEKINVILNNIKRSLKVVDNYKNNIDFFDNLFLEINKEVLEEIQNSNIIVGQELS